MMFPLIGLSVLIHIAIIIFFNIFHITPNNWQKIRRPKIISSVLGSLIIFGVFSFVFVSAAFLVHNTISEKHSTIYFFEHHDIPIASLANVVYLQTIEIKPALAQ